ncbi:MAG: GNAT family N-acetyltransferase [Candidatus Aenigmarchaeota archaeon]|nr:GNAT family N-acetyltransferase [Candidatus Aenigmarchaeota archaeon]
MMSFEDVRAENWDKYNQMIIESERVYPDSIRTPAEEFVDVVREENAVSKVILVDSQYAGNAIGFCMDDEDKNMFGLTDLPGNPKVLYLFNFVINPQYQGMGYGYLLMREFILSAKNMGYDYVFGHFRQNGSLHLIRKFGAQERGIHKNWEDVGEDYVVCCLDLRRIPDSSLNGPVPPAHSVNPQLNQHIGMGFHTKSHCHPCMPPRC